MKQEKIQQVPEAFKDVWDMAAGYTYPEAANNTEQWEKLQTAVSSRNLRVTHRPLLTRKWFVAAAAVALIAGFVGVIYSHLAGGHVEPLLATTGPGEVKTLTLPDGSEVTLNSNSRLSYDAEFSNHNRHITLSGQAHFEVKKNELLPFVVQSSHVNVTVLGTGFNVTDYPAETPSVEVSHGTVQVDAEGQRTILNHNMLARLKDGKLFSGMADATCSWKEGKLIFRQATLREIAVVIKNRFGKTLIMESAVDLNRLFTGSFEQGTTPQAMLNTLNTALGLSMSMQ
jgi:ferric-dicitrate binding protein FerR (iron transport regulator)